MDLTLSPSELAFRDELREWLTANHPGPIPADEDGFEWRRNWQRKLHGGGWAGVWWPEQYGGRGATLIEQAIFSEEITRQRLPSPINVLGIMLAGPTIMVHGTQEQKDRLLEPILSADEIWCQGFSEPDAGSDFGNVQTKAEKVDGGWSITGQKVWTSIAHEAKWCMLVARTDPDVPKHKGLTYFILDMQQDGVDVRGLRQITGSAEFNEVFFQNAFVPDEMVLGEINGGWGVAMTTLMNERAGLAFGMQVAMRQNLDELVEQVRERGVVEDPYLLDRIGELYARTEVLRLTGYRGLSKQQHTGVPGPEGSLPKWMSASTNQEITELAADVLGAEALVQESPWAYRIQRSRGNSIEGGTTEILKNIIAERVLGLPRMKAGA